MAEEYIRVLPTTCSPCTGDVITTVEACASDTVTSLSACGNRTLRWWNCPQTYTASCPTGYSGSPVTKVIARDTVYSDVSQQVADATALASATSQANAALVCVSESSGCCMYPAGGLIGNSYTTADLPDTLRVTYIETGQESRPTIGPVTMTKSGSGYSGTNSSGFSILMVNQFEPDQWITYVGSYEGINHCLIYDDLTNAPVDSPYPLKVEDNFVASSVTDTTTGITTPITRMSQCSWSGGSWTLLYNSTTCKWNLNGGVKTSGYQNTPTGTYTTGIVTA